MQFPPYLVVAPVRWKAQWWLFILGALAVRRLPPVFGSFRSFARRVESTKLVRAADMGWDCTDGGSGDRNTTGGHKLRARENLTFIGGIGGTSMRRSGCAVRFAGLILTIFLVGYATASGENGAEVGDEDVDSDLAALEDRVAQLEEERAELEEERAELEEARAELEEERAELEEERAELVDERDPLQDDRADSESTQAEAESADPLARGESDFNLVQPSESVRFNDWLIQVTDWKLETSSIGRACPPRGVYLVVTLDVVNDGSTPRSFLGGFTTSAIVSDGNVLYEYDSQASLAYHHATGEGAWHRENIGPGLTDTLNLVFDIQEGFVALTFAVFCDEGSRDGIFLVL